MTKECLKEWSHLSLEKRCARIQQHFDIEVKPDALRRLYLKDKVKIRVNRKDLYPHNKDLNELEELRKEFAVELSDLLIDPSVHVIYIDQSSVAVEMA